MSPLQYSGAIPSVIHLRAAGSSVVLDARGGGVPAFLHWGRDLGDLDSDSLAALADAQVPAIAHAAPDVPVRASVFPLLSAGWQGHPALAGIAAGLPAGEPDSPEPFMLAAVERLGTVGARIRLESSTLALDLEYLLTPEGLLRAAAVLTNLATVDYALDELNVMLPVPERAVDVLNFSGRWSGERQPQRHRLAHGSIVSEIRHGRPGHDSPFVLIAGVPGYGFGSGEVWATHLGWSGNQRSWVERQPSGQSVLGAGELLGSGEVVLAQNESYSTPPVYGSWSGEGLDGAAARYHRYLRRTRGFDERRHPVILNTWEAVYFDHDDDTLRALADLAASVGVERFVLDDGWMSGRVDDRRGLGDWSVDTARRPDGLGPLIEHVRSLGMEFGLWVEPEMLNLDSDTARQHPEWILGGDHGVRPIPARHQFVLDLSIPAAWNHVLDQLDALLAEHPIVYLKWDHNRDLLASRAREQTLAVYRLMDELAKRHPDVEIESCASGGGRIDFGILERTTRVWPSDTNDPLERQSIYRWTTQLIPPELFGAHLGAATAHTTGRTHSLAFRLATALFGWAGIEWNLKEATPEELAAVTTWIAAYKGLRPTLHRGRVVRADRNDGLWVHGVVAPGGSDAVFAIVAMERPSDNLPATLRLPGLDPDAEYTLEIVDLGAQPRFLAVSLPPWMSAGTGRLSGRLLTEVGVAAPPLAPEQALVVRASVASL